jgi:hypothetical protein
MHDLSEESEPSPRALQISAALQAYIDAIRIPLQKTKIINLKPYYQTAILHYIQPIDSIDSIEIQAPPPAWHDFLLTHRPLTVNLQTQGRSCQFVVFLELQFEAVCVTQAEFLSLVHQERYAAGKLKRPSTIPEFFGDDEDEQDSPDGDIPEFTLPGAVGRPVSLGLA